jgi:hypothetical protein
MSYNKKSRVSRVVLVVVLIIFALLAFFEGTGILNTSSVVAASFDQMFLPLLMRNLLEPSKITPIATATPTQTPTKTATATSTPGTPQVPLFGVDMDHITSGNGLDQMVDANITWARPVGVLWSSIEPTEGIYDWSVLADLQAEMVTASNNGIQIVLIVHSTPEWARKIAGPGPTCGPIADNKLPAFGNFMRAMVARYSVAPFNVIFWELWNEPDTPIISEDRGFGCWGDASDPYYGGGYYADMLKAVYPQIKAANAEAQVLIGGLLLDCDPRGIPSVCETVHLMDPGSALPPKFLEGILRNNGGPYFDGVSFHAYDYYSQTSGQYANPNWSSAWNTTGPVLIAKTRFIQGVLSQYGVTGKFLMNTETALICGSTGFEPQCLTDAFTNAKTYYVIKSYAAGIAEGLRANLWYTVFGWRGSGLLNYDLSPQLAYISFKFAISELTNTAYAGVIVPVDIGGVPGVMGYKYLGDNSLVWVLWSMDGNTHTINLPSTPLTAWDALGNPMAPAVSINITEKPYYLEWNR